jgi:hypothetical protein
MCDQVVSGYGEMIGLGNGVRSHIYTWSGGDVLSRLKIRGSLRTMPTNTELFLQVIKDNLAV